MAFHPPEPTSTPMGRAMSAAREEAGKGLSMPPPLPRHVPPPRPAGVPPMAQVAARSAGTPPPLPTRLYATLQESAAEAAEKLRSARAARLLDEGELERFRNLVIFARTMVESRFQGRHKSPDLGGGGEFAEYLAYQPGLPVQAVDWRVYARTRKLVIRRYRQETDMDVHLVVDASGSMAYQGGNRDLKGLRAARIAAALAFLMVRQGDKASFTVVADRVLEHLPAGGTRRHLMAGLRALVRPAHEAAGRTDLPAAIRECDRLLRRRGRLVVLSDFLGHEVEEIFDAFAPFLHRGFEILLMQLNDPDELTLPHAPLARFVDMETGETVEVEPSEIRADYQRRMEERCAEFAAAAARRRIDFAAFDTEHPYREAVEAYLGFRRGRNH